MSRFQVSSEIGRLREVVLHRPGFELRRITPANRDSLLFDELVWVAKAQQEHDGFAQLLRDEGVRVRYLHELLEEALADEGPRKELIERIATPDTCGAELVDTVRGWLGELPLPDLVAHLVGGVTVEEVPGAGEGFVGGMLGPYAFLVPPLPNAMFTRDPTAWIGDRVLLAVMNKTARIGERLLWETIYSHHPELSAAGQWYGEGEHGYHPASIEGGDLLVLSEEIVAAGISERSHPVAVENLAARLFAGGTVKRILGVDLPKERTTMHLDTVLTVVDRDAVVIWPQVLRGLRVLWIEPGPHGRMRVTEAPDLRTALADALGVDRLRIITTGDHEPTASREQWDDGNNTLALRPGVVVAYERNVDTNKRLREAGIDVRTIESFELPRGRGGPRCMSCPLLRDPL